VAHVFLFDIVPWTTTPRWIAEGLAEYERGAWDPSDLVTLRDTVRNNTIPAIAGYLGDNTSANPRMVYALGHAAFDFIEARWGKPGVRQFIFWLRQTATKGGDPYERALKIPPSEFDQGFDQYLRQRFAASARQARAEGSDNGTPIRIEGDVTSINLPISIGFACIELWVEAVGRIRQRWAVECDDEAARQVLQILKPGDRVILVGHPPRTLAPQRIVMRSLVRPSDGSSWRTSAD
jgi:hypothetical protein